MKIFGKRPFVLKTAEMGPKLRKIVPVKEDTSKTAPPEKQEIIACANRAISETRGWLTTIAGRAEIYKDAQTHAETVRKLLSKKTLSQKDREQLTDIVNQLGSIPPKYTTNTIYEDPEIKNFKPAEIPKSFERGKIDWYDLENDPKNLPNYKPTLLKDSQTLEANCRKAKQQLKDMFEKVYKLTKSFVKDFEKARSKAEKDSSKRSSKRDTPVLDTSKMKALAETYVQTLVDNKVLTYTTSEHDEETQ